jgi:hypothetical protein
MKIWSGLIARPRGVLGDHAGRIVSGDPRQGAGLDVGDRHCGARLRGDRVPGRRSCRSRPPSTRPLQRGSSSARTGRRSSRLPPPRTRWSWRRDKAAAPLGNERCIASRRTRLVSREDHDVRFVDRARCSPGTHTVQGCNYRLPLSSSSISQPDPGLQCVTIGVAMTNRALSDDAAGLILIGDMPTRRRFQGVIATCSHRQRPDRHPYPGVAS